jgi:hypothetical protein
MRLRYVQVEHQKLQKGRAALHGRIIVTFQCRRCKWARQLTCTSKSLRVDKTNKGLEVVV